MLVAVATMTLYFQMIPYAKKSTKSYARCITREVTEPQSNGSVLLVAQVNYDTATCL